MSQKLSGGRRIFSEPQAAQYFHPDRLEKMTGRKSGDWHRVVVKELMDNALDAAESAGRVPVVGVAMDVDPSLIRLIVQDNGVGIPADVIERMLETSVSSLRIRRSTAPRPEASRVTPSKPSSACRKPWGSWTARRNLALAPSIYSIASRRSLTGLATRTSTFSRNPLSALGRGRQWKCCCPPSLGHGSRDRPCCASTCETFCEATT